MDMEKAGYPQQLEAGLLVVPDGSDAPMVVSELPQPVNSGALPARTGSPRRHGDLCPMGSEALEHAPGKESSEQVREMEREKPRVVVIRRRTLWIALAVFLIVVAAVIGGAVGGTRRSKKSSAVSEVQDSTPSPSGALQTSNSTSPTSSPSPTPTIDIGYRMQVWSEKNYKGRTQIFHNTGGYKLNFLGKSYHWNPGKYVDTWQCSTSTCFDDPDKQGWRGVTEKLWPGAPANESEYGLIYLNIVCAHDYDDPGCPGPADATTYVTYPEAERSMVATWTGTSLDESLLGSGSSTTTRSESSGGRSTPATAGAASPTQT